MRIGRWITKGVDNITAFDQNIEFYAAPKVWEKGDKNSEQVSLLLVYYSYPFTEQSNAKLLICL